jgi:hypothetical protein
MQYVHSKLSRCLSYYTLLSLLFLKLLSLLQTPIQLRSFLLLAIDSKHVNTYLKVSKTLLSAKRVTSNEGFYKGLNNLPNYYI